VSKLIVSRKGELECDTETLLHQHPIGGHSTNLDTHDGHAADERADRNVNHGVLLPIFGDHLVDHVQREDRDKGHVEEEGLQSEVLEKCKIRTWLRGVLQYLVDCFHFFIGGCMKDNDY
jgi:hypothetical protein